MKPILVAISVWAFSASVGLAAVMPSPGSGDPRIQTVDYDPQQVVSLRVALNYSLTLEFSPEERIENVAVGASGAWQVTPNKSADHLFIKAGLGAMSTDMTVVTDVRSYNFELHPLVMPDPTTAILIRFRYPRAVMDNKPAPPLQVSYYRFRGDKFLHPADMRDDGQATYIVWGAKTPIPAVFIVESDGRKTLADGAVRDGQFVIDRIGNEFIFRLGDHEEQARRYTRMRHTQ